MQVSHMTKGAHTFIFQTDRTKCPDGRKGSLLARAPLSFHLFLGVSVFESVIKQPRAKGSRPPLSKNGILKWHEVSLARLLVLQVTIRLW